MTLEVIQNPEQDLLDFIAQQISQYNWAHWQNVERKPLAVSWRDEQSEVKAGASGRTFGHWLLLDYLWVSDTLRGQGIGSQCLTAIEQAAKARGCTYVLLDTLDFQAQPFYERHGYETQWVQQQYPLDGKKYFMSKQLHE